LIDDLLYLHEALTSHQSLFPMALLANHRSHTSNG
jgi:hypothetical protein